MTTAVLPDVERICIAYLTDHTEVDALVDGRVYSDPFDKVVRPFLTVRRIGGAAAFPHWVDTALIEVSAWSWDRGGISGRQEARLICETAVAALHDMPAIDDGGLAVRCHVADQTGPRSVPDPDTGKPRFIAEVLVTVHPYTAAS